MAAILAVVIKVFIEHQPPIFDNQNAVNVLILASPIRQGERITTFIFMIDKSEYFVDPDWVNPHINK